VAATAEAQQRVRDSTAVRTTVRTERRETEADTVVLRIAADSLRLLPEGAIYWARGHQTELRVGRDTTGTLVVTAETTGQVDRTTETTETLTQKTTQSDSSGIRELRPPDEGSHGSRFGWRELLSMALAIGFAAVIAGLLKRS
jgi:hypothetical protein